MQIQLPFSIFGMVVLYDSTNTTTRTITPASTSFRFVLYVSMKMGCLRNWSQVMLILAKTGSSI